jgi:hypothetical protein
MGYRVEMVTPKLTYEELPKFQECVRRVRKAGAKVNSSCGLHVHVDAANHNRQSLKNLIGIMYSKEDILFKALQVDENRASRWCQKVREPMLQEARRLSSEETKDFTKLENIWYEGDNGSNEHYNWTRYYALNLHSVFYRGTVEWRCFNSTLHAGRAAAYVNLCLAISAQAIAQLCTVCGAGLAEPSGHSYQGEVTAPTCIELGYITYTCDNCGYFREHGHVTTFYFKIVIRFLGIHIQVIRKYEVIYSFGGYQFVRVNNQGKHQNNLQSVSVQ